MPTKPEGVKTSIIGAEHALYQPEPIYWDEDARELYVDSRSRYEFQLRKDDNWYAVFARPGVVATDYFHGVFDLFSGAGINVLQTDRNWYANEVGAGSFTAVNALNAGLRITTGAVTGNNMVFGSGDDNGLITMFKASNELFLNLKFRWPEAADLQDSSLLFGLYYDADNYICLRYDSSVDTLLRFVTRSEGSETVTSLGSPSEDEWFSQQYYLTASLARMYCECGGETTYEHTTNIPSTLLGVYCKFQTLADAAKKFDIQHVRYVA